MYAWIKDMIRQIQDLIIFKRQAVSAGTRRSLRCIQGWGAETQKRTAGRSLKHVRYGCKKYAPLNVTLEDYI
jgi:hypothetical protein